MTPTLSPTERRDLMTVLEWCGPDMVEWGLLAWENRLDSLYRSSRGMYRAACSCFVGEMGGGDVSQFNRLPYREFARQMPMATLEAMGCVYDAFEFSRWRTAARPIIEDWLARQRGAA